MVTPKVVTVTEAHDWGWGVFLRGHLEVSYHCTLCQDRHTPQPPNSISPAGEEVLYQNYKLYGFSIILSPDL